MSIRLNITVLMLAAAASTARGQNPVQWSGSVPLSVDRAREQSLPLMFWVTDSPDDLGDDDDLRDAQEAVFRDPIVVSIVQHHFVPVRVGRNSRVMEAAEQFGLPTSHGLYVAVITADRQLLSQLGPGELADSRVVAERLTQIFRAFRDDLYAREHRPVIQNLQAEKLDVRRSVQLVWRLGILSADSDLVALLGRADLTPAERKRLYTLLASFATPVCVDALLTAAESDPEAAKALTRAEPGALETLLQEVPASAAAIGADGLTPRQLAAYQAAARLARVQSPRPPAFWSNAAADRDKALEALRQRAEPVLAYWQEDVGAWR